MVSRTLCRRLGIQNRSSPTRMTQVTMTSPSLLSDFERTIHPTIYSGGLSMPSVDLSEVEKRAVGLADQATQLVEGGDAKVSL